MSIVICNTDFQKYIMRQWHHSPDLSMKSVHCILSVVYCSSGKIQILPVNRKPEKENNFFIDCRKKLQIDCKRRLAVMAHWLEPFFSPCWFRVCERGVLKWNSQFEIYQWIIDKARIHTLTYCRQFCDEYMCIGITFSHPVDPCMRKQNI